jgi:hypothetical protein
VSFTQAKSRSCPLLTPNNRDSDDRWEDLLNQSRMKMAMKDQYKGKNDPASRYVETGASATRRRFTNADTMLYRIPGGSGVLPQRPNSNAVTASVDAQTTPNPPTRGSQSLNKVRTVVRMPKRLKRTSLPPSITNGITARIITVS